MPLSLDLELTGPQFRPLNDALRATLTLSEFDRMLKERLDINREDYTLGPDYRAIVNDVIDALNKRGRVCELVEVARHERPKNPVFVEYARLVGIGPRGLPDAITLEKIVKESNALLDIAMFRSHVGEIEGQVCRIDLQGNGLATGFLVGPSMVMTNYHVIESMVAGQHGAQNFKCRFDYKVKENGIDVNPGIVFNVVQLLAHSPYDPADLQKNLGVPDPENLDYALLLLEGEPGNDPIGGQTGGDPRGWIRMPQNEHAFALGSPLFIVQHPNTKPMKLALDTAAIIGLNGNKTRVEYATNTDPGSSGSPCFSQNWELVALHHSGDPNWIPTWNEGIPIVLIHSDIKKKGFAQHLV
jgi:hypothetical protein